MEIKAISKQSLKKNLNKLKESFDLSIAKVIENRDGSSQNHITFMLDSETFACPVIHFKEIVTEEKIIPVPEEREHLLGVINYKNRVLPVINLNSLLRLNKKISKQKRYTLFITKNLKEESAILVDDTGIMLPIAEKKISPLPVSINSETGKFIKGELYYQKKLITVLDLSSY